MTGADSRAVLGTVLALTGGALLLHDLWQQLRGPGRRAEVLAPPPARAPIPGRLTVGPDTVVRIDGKAVTRAVRRYNREEDPDA